VRTLAHELGRRLGCGAHLAALRRARAGTFTLADAVPLDVLEQEGVAAALRLIPLERLLPAIPSVVLTEDGVRRALHGNLLPPSAHESELPLTARVRLLDGAGQLVGIAELEPGGLLHPVIVLM